MIHLGGWTYGYPFAPSECLKSRGKKSLLLFFCLFSLECKTLSIMISLNLVFRE